MTEENEVFLAGKIVPYSSEVKAEKRIDLNEEGESLLATLTITEYRDINENSLDEFIDQQKLRRSIMKNQKVDQSVLQEYSLNATDLYIVRQVSIKLETGTNVLFADFDENRINEFNEHNKVHVNLYTISNFLINALTANEAANNIILYQPNNGDQYYFLLREEGKRIQIPMVSEQGKEDPDDADDEAGIVTQEQDNNTSSSSKSSSSSSDEYTKQEEPPMSSDANADNNQNQLSSTLINESKMRRPTQTDSSSIAQMEDCVFAAAAKIQSPRTATSSDSDEAASPAPHVGNAPESDGSDFDGNPSPPIGETNSDENDKIVSGSDFDKKEELSSPHSSSSSTKEESHKTSSDNFKSEEDPVPEQVSAEEVAPVAEIKQDTIKSESDSSSESENKSEPEHKPESEKGKSVSGDEKKESDNVQESKSDSKSKSESEKKSDGSKKQESESESKSGSEKKSFHKSDSKSDSENKSPHKSDSEKNSISGSDSELGPKQEEKSDHKSEIKSDSSSSVATEPEENKKSKQNQDSNKNSSEDKESEPKEESLSDSLHSLSQHAPIQSSSSSSSEDLGDKIKEKIGKFFGKKSSSSSSSSDSDSGYNTKTETESHSEPPNTRESPQKSSSSSSSEEEVEKEVVKPIEEEKPPKPPTRKFGLTPNFASVKKREQIVERSFVLESRTKPVEPVYKATSRAKRHDLFVSDSDHEIEKEDTDGKKRYETLGKRSRWLVQSSDDESIVDYEKKAKNEVIVRTAFADDELSEESVYQPRKCSRKLPSKNTYLRKSESSSSSEEKSDEEEETDFFVKREKKLQEKLEKRKQHHNMKEKENKDLNHENEEKKSDDENIEAKKPSKGKASPGKKGVVGKKGGKKASPAKKNIVQEKAEVKDKGKVPKEKEAEEKVPPLENERQDDKSDSLKIETDTEKKEVKRKVIASKYIAADFSDSVDSLSSDDFAKGNNSHKKHLTKKHRADKEKEEERKRKMAQWQQMLKENEPPREHPLVMGSRSSSKSEQKKPEKAHKKPVRFNKPAPVDPKSPLVATKFIGFESSDDEAKEPKRISKTHFKDDSARGQKNNSRPTRTKTIKRVASSTDEMLNKQ